MTSWKLKQWYDSTRMRYGKLDKRKVASGSPAISMTHRDEIIFKLFAFMKSYIYHKSERETSSLHNPSDEEDAGEGEAEEAVEGTPPVPSTPAAQSQAAQKPKPAAKGKKAAKSRAPIQGRRAVS